MPNVEFTQTDFSAGELSPRLHGRLDSPLYAKGLELASNWQIAVQGGLVRRNGSDLIAPLLDSTDYRLIGFRTAKGERFAVGFGDQKIRIYDDRGELYQDAGGGGGPGLDLVRNGNFAKGLGYWTVSAVGPPVASVYQPTVHSDALYLRKGYEVSQDITVTVSGEYVFGFTATLLEGTALQASLLARGPDMEFTPFFADTGWPGVRTHRMNLPPGVYRIRFGSTPGSGSTLGAAVVDDVQFYRAGAAQSAAAPWGKDEVERIQFVMETALDRLWLVHPAHVPHTLTRNQGGVWVLEQPLFIQGPAEWGTDNYPSAVELYQSRLWLAGCPNDQGTVWASASDNLLDFRLTEDVQGEQVVTARCAIKFTAQTKGAIRWMAGKAALILGTDLGEYAVQAQGGALAPNDLQVTQTSAHGCAAIQAIQLGDQIVYVSNDRRRLRAMSYDFSSANWASRDLALVADHLTEGRIKEIHLTRDPLPTLCVILASGEVRFCTFDRAEQVAAWWRFDTDGIVRSAAVLDGDEGSSVWLSVVRRNGIYLEKFTLDGRAGAQLDSAVTRTPAGLVVSGLEHLNGEKVGVVVDGALRPDAVVANGQITLDAPGTTAVVGLPFRARGKTLPPNVQGASQRAKRRWVKLHMRLNNSALPLINGRRLPDRSPSTPQDTREPLRTGDFGAESSDWEGRGQVLIEQDLPLPTEIVALFGALAVSEV